MKTSISNIHEHIFDLKKKHSNRTLTLIEHDLDLDSASLRELEPGRSLFHVIRNYGTLMFSAEDYMEREHVRDVLAHYLDLKAFLEFYQIRILSEGRIQVTVFDSYNQLIHTVLKEGKS